ncbi:MAG: PhzF family phenazine biosynthesis protein, partial [Bacteroidia bacterium]|nr:PhzF family phenazine biosynthesis protein [Bacteroidia bacterium]
ASEFNLSETAFIVKTKKGYHLRWFTPVTEVRLCGHATLASAHIIFQHLDYPNPDIVFTTQAAGDLIVSKSGSAYLMDFPADKPKAFDDPKLQDIFKAEVKESYRGMDDILLILSSEDEVLDCNPDYRKIGDLDARALIISAPGKETDFVSRVFAPACGIDEDPVTGSAHTLMTPYWSARLNKQELTAAQVSKRRGDLICRIKGDRVLLTGSAVTVFKGELII